MLLAVSAVFGGNSGVVLRADGMGDSVSVDTVEADSLSDTARVSKSMLDQPVVYQAKDSIVFHMGTKRASLYGESQVDYTNLKLNADMITISMDSSLVHAQGRSDSIGEIVGKPKFSQGGDQYDPDRISYNFKTRKAFVRNIYTEQGEGFLQSEDSKRDSTGIMYIRHGKYTTCDEAHPHFYMALTRAKVIPGKSVVFGPAYLVLEDIPLPLAIPYGFFPFSKKFHSGVIFPTFGDESSRGFYLRDGGYYFAISDYLDEKLLGEIYTKGSWGLSSKTNYMKRYRFAGSVDISYQKTITGEKNMPDYSAQSSFRVQWSHRQDAKANPSTSFSASVNFATSNYERNNINSLYNPAVYSQSTRTSSVSFSKTWSRIGLSVSLSTNLSQNVRDSSLSVTLPNMSISLQRFYPFKRKRQVGKERWYEKISMQYSGALSWSINTKEDKFFKSNLIKDWRNGMKHNIPVSATFQLFKYINVSPSFNFTDRMYSNRIDRSWDVENQREVRDTTYGFYNVYNFNLAVSANTKLYGFFRPIWKNSKIMAVRHVLTPSVSFSYAPDFSDRSWGFYDTYVRTDRNGNVTTETYSPFSQGMYGTAPSGKQGVVSFDIGNNLEMKLRSKKDSTGYRKISLIDEFGVNMSYNFAAKRHQWSDLNTRIRLKLTKNYTFSMNAVFATYAYEIDENDRVRVGDRTEYSQGRFGRFQGMSQNFSYTLNNQTFRKIADFFSGRKKKDDIDKTTDEEKEFEYDPYENDSNIDPETRKHMRGGGLKRKEKAEVDADGYMRFTMPWSLSLSYGITMRENTAGTFNRNTMRYPYMLTHTFNFSGNVAISDGWNISFTSGYDFNYKQLSMTSMSLSRDLHCFQMTASVVLRPYTCYNFTFQAKASALADVLKWKKDSDWGNNLNWY